MSETMQVQVTFYGVLQQIIGARRLTLELPAGADVGALADALVGQYPALAERLPTVAFAVGDALVDRRHTLHPDDHVALLPPVSGG